MNTPNEEQPAAVAAKPQQAREALCQQWDWVERTVWTDRMLTALQSGAIKGGKWFRLIDKVYDLRNQRWPNAYFERAGLYVLESAWRQSRQSRV